METFRSSSLLLGIVLSLACMPQPASEAAAGVETAAIQPARIEHVVPSRDSVGRQPTRLEWTAVDGVESYALSVENEIEIEMFGLEDLKTNSAPWPKEIKLDPGTYFWRIIALKGNRVIADSGRAAFLIREP